jgi:hypothetical protein
MARYVTVFQLPIRSRGALKTILDQAIEGDATGDDAMFVLSLGRELFPGGGALA